MTTSFKPALALLVLASWSCSCAAKDATICTPGTTQACVCPAGKTGAQACEKDGMSWGGCYGCPAAGGDARGDSVTDAGSAAPSDHGVAGCTKTADLLDSDACGPGKACAIIDSSGKLGCVATGTTAFHQPCADLSSCVAGAGCLGLTTSTLTCLPFCERGGTPCPKGSACTGTFHTSVGDIGLCLLNANCDLVTGTGCPSLQGCYVGDANGNPVCATAGQTAEGGSCATSDQCLPGMVCSKTFCRRLCHDNSPCVSPSTCKGMGFIFSAAPTVGICSQ